MCEKIMIEGGLHRRSHSIPLTCLNLWQYQELNSEKCLLWPWWTISCDIYMNVSKPRINECQHLLSIGNDPFDWCNWVRAQTHLLSHCPINTYHRRDRADDTFKMFTNCQHSGIWWRYSESPWEMHCNKYKHAQYWFKNSWNSLWNFKF